MSSVVVARDERYNPEHPPSRALHRRDPPEMQLFRNLPRNGSPLVWALVAGVLVTITLHLGAQQTAEPPPGMTQFEVVIDDASVVGVSPNREMTSWGGRIEMDGDPHVVFDWTTSEPYAALVGVRNTSEQELHLVELRPDGTSRRLAERVEAASYNHDLSLIQAWTDGGVTVLARDDGREHVRIENAYGPIWSPVRNELLFVQLGESTTNRIAIADFDTETVRHITDGKHGDYGPTFHPSGEWILFASPDRAECASMFRVGRDGGLVTPVVIRSGSCRSAPMPLTDGLWSRDGRWYLYEWRPPSGAATWALHFDDHGRLVHSGKLADGGAPRWVVDGQVAEVGDKAAGADSAMRVRVLP